FGRDAGGFERCAKQFDVAPHFLVADVGDCTGHDHAFARRRPGERGIELRELEPLARAHRHPSRLAGFDLSALEAAEALSVIGQTKPELADFAVADDVDAGRRLLANDIDHPASNRRVDATGVRWWGVGIGPRGLPHRPDLRGAFETAGVCGEDPIGAGLHITATQTRTTRFRPRTSRTAAHRAHT